ncbi:putative trna pseudouridine synthase 1 [Nannochloropsis gaditana]|uniref:tRNA pseudouridine(55) synthase n=1 Tax=Nannochloropsis gaditana TaxID=72520 RepID=W7TZ56_9STRA|nr:putative trna pseudouridine synthase 1 [Nannochloropsis gaditana]
MMRWKHCYHLKFCVLLLNIVTQSKADYRMYSGRKALVKPTFRLPKMCSFCPANLKVPNFRSLSPTRSCKERKYLARYERMCTVRGATPGTTAELPPLNMNGLVAIFKPRNWTSNDVVQKVRSLLEKEARRRAGVKVKVKVGHGGTLDPMATGVLVLGVGRGCQDLNLYLKGSKAYRAVGLLGSEYDTMDATGTITETVDVSHVTPDSLEEALVSFRGCIMQRPPVYSALRRKGKRLYELARQGEDVETEPRAVQVDRLDLIHAEDETGHRLEWPYFGLAIECQGGTYVRSLISDVARSVNARAHMTALTRTKHGPLSLDDCLPEEVWKNDAEAVVQHLINLRDDMYAASSDCPQ